MAAGIHQSNRRTSKLSQKFNFHAEIFRISIHVSELVQSNQKLLIWKTKSSGIWIHIEENRSSYEQRRMWDQQNEK